MMTTTSIQDDAILVFSVSDLPAYFLTRLALSHYSSTGYHNAATLISSLIL